MHNLKGFLLFFHALFYPFRFHFTRYLFWLHFTQPVFRPIIRFDYGTNLLLTLFLPVYRVNLLPLQDFIPPIGQLLIFHTKQPSPVTLFIALNHHIFNRQQLFVDTDRLDVRQQYRSLRFLKAHVFGRFVHVPHIQITNMVFRQQEDYPLVKHDATVVLFFNQTQIVIRIAPWHLDHLLGGFFHN
jgi:hypothetical protein